MLTILAIVPGILVSLYVYYRDRHEPEPHKNLLICFFLGAFSTLPAIVMETTGQEIGIVESPNIFMTFAFAFGVVAFSEEIAKFFFLRTYAYPNKEFNEPMDGIVYAVMIGMGFATLENVLYASSYGIETVILRAFTAVPAHGAFAVIMGYYVGLAKFSKHHEMKNFMMGIGGAVLFHGAYDFFLFQQNFPALTGLALVTLVYGLYLGRKMIKIHQMNSPFKKENMENYSEDTYV